MLLFIACCHGFVMQVNRNTADFPWGHPMLYYRGLDDDSFHEALLWHRLSRWEEFPKQVK